MTNLIAGWALNHKDFLIGLASGWAAAHVPLLVSFAFNQAMRVPYLRGLVLSNPTQIKAYLKEIEDTLDKEIDEEVENAKKEAPVAPTTPKA